VDRVKDRPVALDFSDMKDYHLDERFGELAMKHRPVLQAIAYRRVRDYSAAEDIAQEAVAKVCSVLRHASIGAAKAYLNASVVSVATDYLERQIRTRESSLEALLEKDQLPSQLTDFGEPLDVVIRDEEVEEVLSAIASLPPRMAEAMWLRYLEDLDYESIAQRLGYSINTIKSDVRRGRKRVRQKILKARVAYSRVA
jgi:RNA polymerase sigma factor (sigma-70 family)